MKNRFPKIGEGHHKGVFVPTFGACSYLWERPQFQGERKKNAINNVWIYEIIIESDYGFLRYESLSLIYVANSFRKMSF